jgi:hypothetical protein
MKNIIKIRVGQKVKLAVSNGGSSFINDKYNPIDLIGEIISIDGKISPIIVLWTNGIRNSYIEKNLQIA